MSLNTRNHKVKLRSTVEQQLMASAISAADYSCMSTSSSTPRLTATQVLPAIAGIYVSQTIITALTTQALPSLLRSEGLH
ncbi:hypothetical protein ACFSVK_00870 [Azorhizophilus paspali]|uniref:hypothetical protein n=1 Tax=Azorhizophilus paspali TaxID=69963 RepID=UPI00363EA1D8